MYGDDINPLFRYYAVDDAVAALNDFSQRWVVCLGHHSTCKRLVLHHRFCIEETLYLNLCVAF